MIKKKYPTNKPELKKLLNCIGLLSIGVSLFKGRPKRKIRPT